MGRLRIFRNLTSLDGRLGFYTKETREQIPVQPGCYAWFLPLWFYRSNLDDLMGLVRRVLDYEQRPERSVEVPFVWDSVGLRVTRRPTIHVSDGLREIWNRVTSDPTARSALEETLLEASLLMPPLYVGRTKNLQQRYFQHTARTGHNKNDFHSRFTEWARRLELPLSVSDLLFVSLRTRDDLNRTFDDLARNDDVELLIEQLLMQFCRPSFSLK